MKQENVERFDRLERENTELAEGLIDANRNLREAREIAATRLMDCEDLREENDHLLVELLRCKILASGIRASHRVDL